MKKSSLMRRVHAFDLGGSGVKEAVFDAHLGSGCMSVVVQPHGANEKTEWDDFEKWVARRVAPDVDIIAVSCAGFVNAREGEVRLFRVAGWTNRPLMKNLHASTGGKPAIIVNDAEAHLLACTDPPYRHPILAVSLGTALGFAVSTDAGKVYRPRPDSNFDVGSMRLPTSASQKEVWWAIGSHGLDELQKQRGVTEGVKQFGYRLGGFLRDMTIAFQPRSIVLSGGIVEQHWDLLYGPTRTEFEQSLPDFVDSPRLVRSEYAAHAALWGVARLAAFGEV